MEELVSGILRTFDVASPRWGVHLYRRQGVMTSGFVEMVGPAELAVCDHTDRSEPNYYLLRHFSHGMCVY